MHPEGLLRQLLTSDELERRQTSIAYFYEIRSTTDTVLKRDGGFPDREAATNAAREDAKKMKVSRHLGVASVGKILVGQNAEKPTR